MLRQSRKLQHINQALRLYTTQQDSSLFGDVKLLHNCLPELSLAEIDLQTKFLDRAIIAPVLINALTGGSDDVAEYNERLAALAGRLHIPMAVGSQFSAVEKQDMRYTFELVRKVNPDGVILANVGAHANIEQAEAIVQMIDADALQIHINPAQELIMSEGDRDFRGYLDNMLNLSDKLSVPVIIKETGCGMGTTQLQQFADAGITYFDLGGAGGTNFLAIEAARAGVELESELEAWGIPTAANILQAATVLDNSHVLIATGGITTPMQVAKALALGADMAGMAMYFLDLVYRKPDVEHSAAEFELFLADLRKIMLLTGCKRAEQLRTVPIYVGGELRNWVELSGVNPNVLIGQRR